MTVNDTDRSTVLVTGAAGYIGSHAALALIAADRKVVAVDNLSTGLRGLVPPQAAFVEADVGDAATMRQVIKDHRVGAALHFAGSIVVPESVREPLAYYRNNTVTALSLMEACRACDVTRFIFSSTAAVYGEPETLPVDEAAPTRPINPYGASKLMTERMLADAAAAYGLRYGVLRYFNVAGADPQGRSGQCSREATHLIKIACEAAVGRRGRVEVFGADYPTPDGTCVRDYIHVTDLAEAHVAALEHLERGGDSFIANCGYGRGYSVREVLAAVAAAAGAPLNILGGVRRAGDPPALVAGATKIRALLGWRPRFDDLDVIVRHALAWERRLAAGEGPAETGAPPAR